MKIPTFSIHQISVSLGEYIAKEAGQPSKAAVIAFSVETILGDVIKTFLLLTIAWALNIFPYVLVFLLVTGTYRMFSGGTHCTAHYRCFLASFISFIPLAFFLKVSLPFLLNYSKQALIVPLLICFLIAFRWAPVAPENKPLKGKKDYLFRKMLSLCYCSLLSVILLFAGPAKWSVWAVVFSLAWQSFTLMPLGVSLIKVMDAVLIIPMIKGVNENA